MSPTLVDMDKRKEYEANRQFKDSWVVVYPWVENVLGLDGPNYFAQ